MDVSDVRGLLAYRQQIQKEVNSRVKHHTLHGKNRPSKMSECDKKDLVNLKQYESTRKKKKPVDHYVRKVENIEGGKELSSHGCLGKFCGFYVPKNSKQFTSSTKEDFKPPVWDNKEDEEFLKQDQGKHHRTKDIFKKFFEQRSRHDIIMKKAYGSSYGKRGTTVMKKK